MTWLRTFIARRRLAKIVDKTRESYEIRRFRERREAALKGIGRIPFGDRAFVASPSSQSSLSRPKASIPCAVPRCPSAIIFCGCSGPCSQMPVWPK
jgi:hypothetical protein